MMHVAVERLARSDLYKLKDGKTAEEISLEFIGTHPPVAKLKDSD
jgi:hypothetical protein